LNGNSEPSTEASGAATPAVDTTPNTQLRARFWRRWRPWLARSAGLSLLLGGLFAFLFSESGLHSICRLAAALSGGQLTIEAGHGSLADAFSLSTLHWRDETFDLQLSDVQIEWRPGELLHGKLALLGLRSETLRIAHRGSDEALVPPLSLRLPLAVDIDQLHIGRIELADYAPAQGSATLIGADFNARLNSAANMHRLSEVHAQLAQVSVAGEAKLSADRPFELTAHAELLTAAAGRRLRFVIDTDGPLATLSLHGRAATLENRPDERFAGRVQARVEPFNRHLLAQASVQLSGVDPAAWLNGAPTADLDIRAELQPRGDSVSELSGQLTVDNRLPGTLDAQRLPLQSLHSAFEWRHDVWQMPNIDLTLPANGRLRGQGEYRQETLTLDLTVDGLDAQSIDRRLQRTRLTGPLRAQLAAHRQTIDTCLRDAQYAVLAKLRVDPQSVVAESLQLSAGDARLDASGQWSLQADRGFELRGELKNFDPSRFAHWPAARLNASISAQGQLQPALTLRSRFQLRDSRFRGQPLAGHGAIDLAGERLRQADVDLVAAGNQLSVQGAYGAPGDRLLLRIAAPRLAPFGVDGDVHGQLLLAGSRQSPEIDASLRSTRLALDRIGALAGLELQARLGSGERGPLSGELRLAALSSPDGRPQLQALQLRADGQRQAHRLSGSGQLPERRALSLSLDGALAATNSGVSWNGRLNELTVASRFDRPVPLLQLRTPLSLQLAPGRLLVGAGEAQLAGGVLKLARWRYENGLWQSAGALQGLPLLPLLQEFPPLAAALAEVNNDERALRLNGDWDLATTGSRRLPSGKLHVWRETGDVQVHGLSLGLNDADLALQAVNGRYEGRLRVRGQRLGELAGQLNAAASAEALLNPQAPWRGQLHLDVADLAWLGPLLAPVWQFAGRLNGDVQLGGTPAQVRLHGELRGSELAVRKLDQGLRLERGQMWLQLAGEQAGDVRLLLKQLEFESVLQGMPRPLRILPTTDPSATDVSALLAKPGRLQVSGELRAGQTDGVLNIKADRLGAWQRPDQWLLVSGDLQVKLGADLLKLLGKLQVDAAYWEMQDKATPRLSDDVYIKRAQTGKPSTAARLLAFAVDLDLGRRFLFHGLGVDSRLVGDLQIRSEGAGLPRATGTIRTVGGRFDAYGQQLEIARGILNFNGQIDNPGLNIRAVRPHLPVEPGVEVSGNVRKPVVRLVSDPEMPDGEKLSWLILGHPSEQQGGNEAALLLAAAHSLLGGQDGGPLKSIQRELGIDEFAIVSGTLGGSGRRQTSRIAGSSFVADDTASGQIVSIGKRLATNMQLSYEQALTGAGSVVKLTVNLSRNLSLIGRAGSENALDLLWNYRFGR